MECSIKQENLDISSPPKCPFSLQIGVSCSHGIYYFETPCLLINLINHSSPALQKNQFDLIWNQVPFKNSVSAQTNWLASSDAMTKVFENYGFKSLGGDVNTVYLSASTTNNIPIILKGTAIASTINVEICTPVAPLEPLLKEAV